MAKVIFTENDSDQVTQLLAEFDPATHPKLKPIADALPSDEWASLVDVCRQHLTVKIKTCIAARAYFDALSESNLIDDSGRYAFFWGHDVGPSTTNQGVATEAEEWIGAFTHRPGREESDWVVWEFLGETDDEIDMRIFGDLTVYRDRLAQLQRA